jgi:iron(III) transport system permease protein
MLSFFNDSRKLVWLGIFAAIAVSVPLVAADRQARALAAGTILISGTVGVASILVGAPLAFLLARTDVAARRLGELVLLSLLFTPLYLQAAAWQAGFGLQGWLTSLWGGPPLLEGWRGAIIVHTVAAIPWVVLVAGLALRLAEPELEEGALLDATPGQVFRRVTWPRARQAFATAFVWVAITTAGEMTVTDLFQVRTYAEQLYIEFALGDTLGADNWNVLPGVISTLWVVAAGLALIVRLIPPERHVPERKNRVFRLGRWRTPATAAVLSAVGLLVGVPMINFVAKAGMLVSRQDQGFVRQWSPRQFAAIVLDSPAYFSREFGWSILIGGLAATASVVIGLMLAWTARRGGWRAAAVWLTVAVCLALPGPLVGLAIIACFTAPQWEWLLALYDRSIAPIWLAQTLRALPLCTLVLWYALRTIPSELLQSATLDGASASARFFRVALPQRWPSVAAAWLVALAVAAGDLSASILVVPPGVTTLPIQIFGLIHYGVDDRVSAISLILMTFIFVVALAAAVLWRRANPEK